MPIPLPNLDDRTFADLVEEARETIPALAPAWTDHNPSDPGITLVELFAYVAEMLAYRTNQIPEANLRVFHKLLEGGEPAPGVRLDDALRESVLRLRERNRAVTADDYQYLAGERFNAWVAELAGAERASLDADATPAGWLAWLQRHRPADAAGRTPEGAWAEREAWWAREWWRPAGLSADEATRPSRVGAVARVECVPRRDLSAGTEAARTAPTPGRMSVLLLPAPPAGEEPGPPDPEPGWALRRAVWSFLDERRVLTTRHHVVGPRYVPVHVRVRAVRRADVAEADLRGRIEARLGEFFHPLAGGVEGRGWPFGRDVYLSEIYAALERVPGMDHVPLVELASGCDGSDPGCLEAPERWHQGMQVGLSLARHHLPLLSATVVQVGTVFVEARVSVTATPARGTGDERARRAIRLAVHAFFASGAPDGLTVGALRDALVALPEVHDWEEVRVVFDADEAHEVVEAGAVARIRLFEGETADPRVSVTLNAL